MMNHSTDQDRAVIQKQNSGERMVWSSRKRAIWRGIGSMLILAGILSFTRAVWPVQETREQVLYSCQILTDISYRVHLLPNELYPEEWQEEGQVYAELLTDYIEFSPRVEAIGDGAATFTGTYQVTAVLEGYRMAGEKRSLVYVKRFPIAAGAVTQTGPHHAVGEDKLNLRLGAYAMEADRAEQVLANKTGRGFYLLFDGMIQTEAAGKRKETPFSCKISIPLGNGTTLYEIAGPEPGKEAVTITETVTEQRSISRHQLLAGLFLFLAGAGGIMLVQKGTRIPDEQESRELRIRSILRKYGSRMVPLLRLPDMGERELCYLRDMDSLVMLAEELRQPVCYSPAEGGMPEGGVFYVAGAGCYYLVYFPEPVCSTLVEEETAHVSEENETEV